MQFSQAFLLLLMLVSVISKRQVNGRTPVRVHILRDELDELTDEEIDEPPDFPETKLLPESSNPEEGGSEAGKSKGIFEIKDPSSDITIQHDFFDDDEEIDETTSTSETKVIPKTYNTKVIIPKFIILKVIIPESHTSEEGGSENRDSQEGDSEGGNSEGGDSEGGNSEEGDSETDSCRINRCELGKECHLNEEGKAHCTCVKNCPKVDEKQSVCSKHNETWNSRCALDQMRCMCEEDLDGCLSSMYKNLEIDYYGPCKDIGKCAKEQLEDFPHRLRDWFFIIMQKLLLRKEQDEVPPLPLKETKDSHPDRKWVDAVLWKFCDLDVEPRNR